MTNLPYLLITWSLRSYVTLGFQQMAVNHEIETQEQVVNHDTETQEEVVNHETETQEEVINHEVETEEPVGTYHVEEPSWKDDVEYIVQKYCQHQLEVDYLVIMVSDDSGEAFCFESRFGSEGSGDDSDDSDYNVDESHIQFDVDVDITEFHNVVDVDKHGTLNNHSTD
ncbi:unnamed protein product [Lactuca saligna]|uniref:Uncharacterized protein n=1 Tax=Lactuca saligna TaxID=75948 RepID=A0AA35VUD0_LACSI|nr:unnamed protein product [Lactuca saligna]